MNFLYHPTERINKGFLKFKKRIFREKNVKLHKNVYGFSTRNRYRICCPNYICVIDSTQIESVTEEEKFHEVDSGQEYL